MKIVKFIYLSKGKVAAVSEEDFESLSAYSWSVNKNGYAQRTCGNSKIQMHRQIMNAPAGMEVDHINGDKLDNRRENLRICTKAQNQRNCKPKGDRRFKGIGKNGAGWSAALRWAGKRIHLGTFSTQEAAARAYDRAAHQEDPQFARLNFQDGIWTEEQLNAFRLDVKPAESGYKGVFRNGKYWSARVKRNGITKHLGTYSTPHQAHLVREAYLKSNS